MSNVLISMILAVFGGYQDVVKDDTWEPAYIDFIMVNDVGATIIYITLPNDYCDVYYFPEKFDDEASAVDFNKVEMKYRQKPMPIGYCPTPVKKFFMIGEQGTYLTFEERSAGMIEDDSCRCMKGKLGLCVIGQKDFKGGAVEGHISQEFFVAMKAKLDNIVEMPNVEGSDK